ncbi:MAG TPA: FAD-binding oxidoreductase [Candidatus Saccharimonadales bacterium]|nr:FAD-binding oxidoreductase [Candidatus Saccharimonadales bacterium]
MLSRRGFLVSAGATIIGCTTAAVVPSASPSASSTPRPTLVPPTATRSASPTPGGPPDWTALAADLRGTLVRPGNTAYDAARILYNTRFDGLRPQAIARCASPADVQACVAFARRSGVAITARSGGHSFGGWSGGPGLVVDVGSLASIDVRGDTATIGAGARLADVYAAVAAQGRGIAAGSCPTVGIAGLTLGGGLGVLSRAWGLTCDSVLSVDIVTADGATRTCDAQRDPELFWALRGCGGGNFGIVTSFTMRTRPAVSLAIAFVTWPWSDAGRVIRAWQGWMAAMPGTLWSNVHLDAASGPEPTLLVHVVGLEDAATMHAQLDRLVSDVGTAPDSLTVFSRSYADAMLLEGGCAQLTLAQCHLEGTAVDGKLARETTAAKSAIATVPLSEPVIGAMLSGLEDLQALLNAGAGSILIDSMGGAVAQVAADATAFPHRSAISTLQFVAGWQANAPSATADASIAWLRSVYGRVRPLIGTGAYVNYTDPDLADWQQAYYGANYPRLQRVRATYDPDRLFAFPQAIQ